MKPHEGFITPVFVMSENQKRQLGVIVEKKPEPTKLELALRNVEGRSPASLDSDLCQAPAGQFQQCAWSCEGNPKGAKGCQAEQDQVHCVRRTCNAAGQWSPATAFASSYKDLCPAEGIRVGDCSP